ncbi:membrane protein TraL [Desulfocucumis palustris]|uniref:Membrane protein TraL n=1 Tax=Desulfocucumis palustris TaxID=1898651 RepID=A0A2L2XH07_9FIRM|nr:conjugal transfer protein TrbL family protein [Desulfocucumis palustris]GBF35412.1 membrane protein TraL [Desulfocucumis palustris]
MGVLANLIWEGFVNVLAKLYNNLVTSLTGGMLNSMAAALQILDSTYVRNVIVDAQVIGGSLLTLKILYDTLYTYILRANGEPTDPGGLLFRVSMAAAVVGGAPWIARQVYSACTDLATEIAGSQAIDSSQLSPFVALTNPGVIITLVAIAGLVLWILILIQTGVRAVELAVLSITGSVMAVGLTSPDQGTFAAWWRELVVLSMSQVIQIFLVKGALSSLTLVSVGTVMQMFFFLGWLWVAYRTPAVLRQFAYSTGIGGAAAGTAQQAGYLLIMRRIFTRGV